MPNRILKESICTSATVDQLSCQEEVLFYRLIVQCDDYGRLDARPAIILAKCFPLRVDKVKQSLIRRHLARLAEVGLIRLYTVDGSSYLCMTTWDKHQQMRAKRSKYPEPPKDAVAGDSKCNQMLSDDCICPRESESESESESEVESESNTHTSTPGAVDERLPLESLRPEEITAEWNEVCGNRLPVAQKLTADRRRHIKARLQEPGRDLAWWRDYFRRIAASEFCCGGSDGTGWRASIDWAIQSEATVIKVLEGQYDTRAAKPKGYRPAEILR